MAVAGEDAGGAGRDVARQDPLRHTATSYDDCVAVLRDRRFHSALSMLPSMSGVDDETLTGRQQRSILAMEGPEHARIRRLVAPTASARSGATW